MARRLESSLCGGPRQVSVEHPREKTGARVRRGAASQETAWPQARTGTQGRICRPAKPEKTACKAGADGLKAEGSERA